MKMLIIGYSFEGKNKGLTVVIPCNLLHGEYSSDLILHLTLIMVQG